MPISTALKNQVEAIQSQIDTLAPSASAEDVVMLAKAVEAVGGQATLFDVMETGEIAKGEILTAIDNARTQAIDDVLEAGGFTQSVQDEISGIRDDMLAHFDQLLPEEISLGDDPYILPSSTSGTYIISVPNQENHDMTIPDFTGENDKRRTYLFINNSHIPVYAKNNDGDVIGIIPAQGFSFAYVISIGESLWEWNVTNSDPNMKNLILDSPWLLLDSNVINFLDVCPVQQGFVAAWVVGYTLTTCLLRWEENHLVAYPPATVDVGDNGNCYFLVMDRVSENRVIVVYNANPSGTYSVCARVVDVFADGVISYGPECVLQDIASSGYQLAIRMTSSTSGFIAQVDSASSTYYCYGFRISISGDTVSSSSQLNIVSGASESQLRYFTADSVDCLGSKALFMSPAYGTGGAYKKVFYINNTSTPTQIANVDYSPVVGVVNNTQAIRFIDGSLALACWVGPEKSIFWRLIDLTVDSMTMGNWGTLGDAIAPYQANNKPTLRLVVVSQNTVALFIAGSTEFYSKVVFGTVSEDRQTMTWGEWAELPSGIKFNSYIGAAYHPDRNALVFVAGSNQVTPVALTIKM